MSAPKITLEDWAERQFDPPPSERTLRRWVKARQIVPAPIRIGRAYWVQPEAKHIAEAKQTLLQRLAA
jgi:hypothetical protein